MSGGQRKFEATITTRYGLLEKNIYEQVIDLVKKNGLPKSRAQLLLVERGLQHTHNPEPLIKEKVVYKDRPVEKIVEKVVYRDRPKQDKDKQHLRIVEHIGGDDRNSQAGALSAKLTSGDKADPPSFSRALGNTALEEKKADTKDTGLGWVVGGVGVVGVILYLLIRYTS